MSAKVHFEIQGKTDQGWTVLEVANDENKAVTLAKQRLKSASVDAVKVSKECFDPDQGTFKSVLVYEEDKGQPQRGAPVSGQVAAPCQTPDDFGRWEICLVASRSLREVLDVWGLIYTEFLYNFQTFQRLSKSGQVLPSAINSALEEMLPGEDYSRPARAKAVMQLIKEGAAKLQRVQESGTIPDIKKDDFFALAVQYEGQEGGERFLSLAVMKLFARFESIDQRFTWLLQNLNPLPAAWSVALVDRWLAECLMHARVVESLTEGLGDGADWLVTLMMLAEGRLGDAFFKNEKLGNLQRARLAHLHAHLAHSRLPKVRELLINRAADRLAERKPLAGNHFLQELAALAKVYQHPAFDRDAQTRYGPIGQMLETRCSRLLHSDAIGELTEKSVDPYPGLLALAELEPVVIGGAAKLKIGEYMIALISSPRRADALRKGEGKLTQRMKELAALQSKILESGLTMECKVRLSKALDQQCSQMLEDSGFLAKLQSSRGSTYDKANKLGQLLAEGYFTEGNAGDLARRHVWNFLATRDVISRLIRPRATAEERAELEGFQKLLAAAGVAGGG